MENAISELIYTLKRLKSEIEGELPLEYQTAIEKAIGIIQAVEKLNIKGFDNE